MGLVHEQRICDQTRSHTNRKMAALYLGQLLERLTVLTIHYGDMDGVIYNTSTFFNNVYSPEWLEDELAQRMIKSIDGGEVLGPNAIMSRILDPIPPE